MVTDAELAQRPLLEWFLRETGGAPLCTVAEAARMTACSVDTISRAIESGALPVHHLGAGRHRRILCLHLANWIERANP